MEGGQSYLPLGTRKTYAAAAVFSHLVLSEAKLFLILQTSGKERMPFWDPL